MELQNIRDLLNRASAINKQYEKIANLTGENFNVFKVLGLTTNEVRTHSAFIGELLNPKGSHGQKEIFLKLFIDQLQIDDFSYDQAFFEKEKYISCISEDCTEGGNIDIVLTDSRNTAIIIENKINAGDQQNQLLRYHKYGRDNCSSFKLYYLTLDGKNASDWSKNILKENEDFKRISYSEDILNWLEKCKEKAVNHPVLRESITQYIYLIKYLTHQTTNKQMENELVSTIINNPESIESAETIANSWEQIKLGIMDSLKIEIEKDVTKIPGLKVEFDTIDFGKKNSSFWVFKDGWKYCIHIYFEKDFDVLLIGVDTINSDDTIDTELAKLVQQKLSNINLGTILNYPNWVWVCRFEEWTNTEWKDVLLKTPKAIGEFTKKILSNLEEINL